MNVKKIFSIRLKVIIIVASSIILLLASIYIVSTSILLESYRKIERNQIIQNSQRANDAILNTIDQLSVKLADWAWWDDSYQFIQDKNKTYIESNLSVDSISNLRINTMVFMTSEGEIVFKRLIDFETKEEVPSDSLGEYIRTNEIFRISDLEAKVQGIILLPEGPMLIATLPVLTSHGEGPTYGTISFGKFLDDSLVGEIKELTHLVVTLYPYENSLVPADVIRAKTELLKGTGVFTAPFGEDLIAGYSVLLDIYGEPALILKVETPRDVYSQGLQTLYFFMGIAIATIFIFGMSIIALLERFFTSRFSKLSKEVEHIGETKNFKERLTEGKKDEIGILTVEINHMLEALLASQEAERKSRVVLEAQMEETAEKSIALKEQIIETEKSKSAVLNLLEDIEEEKKKVDGIVIERTKELSSEKARLLASINSLAFGFVIADTEHQVIMKNKAIVDLFNLKESDQISIDQISKLLGEDLNIKMEVERCLKDKKLCEIKEIAFDSKFFRGIIAPILTPETNENIGYVFLLEDITEARVVDKAKSEFVALASHQLRTPLSAINWYTEMLISGDAGKLNKEQREYLDEVHKSSSRMSDLVGSLLNVSRIDLGTFTINPEPINICEALESELALLKLNVEEKKLKLDLRCDLETPIIPVDKQIISIIFQNLLTNAIKYTPPGGKITLVIDKDSKQENVVISVADTGYGIPKGEQSKIFTKMYRADNIKDKDTDGNGLGLYMIKTMIDEAGCAISFSSEENKGTIFSLFIPISGMKSKVGSQRLGVMVS